MVRQTSAELRRASQTETLSQNSGEARAQPLSERAQSDEPCKLEPRMQRCSCLSAVGCWRVLSRGNQSECPPKDLKMETIDSLWKRRRGRRGRRSSGVSSHSGMLSDEKAGRDAGPGSQDREECECDGDWPGIGQAQGSAADAANQLHLLTLGAEVAA